MRETNERGRFFFFFFLRLEKSGGAHARGPRPLSLSLLLTLVSSMTAHMMRVFLQAWRRASRVSCV